MEVFTFTPYLGLTTVAVTSNDLSPAEENNWENMRG